MKLFLSILILVIMQIVPSQKLSASDNIKTAYEDLPVINLPYGNDSDFYENEEQAELSPLPSNLYKTFDQTHNESSGEVRWGRLPSKECMIILVKGWEEWGDEQISLFTVSENDEIIDKITLSSARDEVINSTEQLTSTEQDEDTPEEIGCRSTTFYIDQEYSITITERLSAVGYSEVTNVDNYKLNEEGKIENVSLEKINSK